MTLMISVLAGLAFGSLGLITLAGASAHYNRYGTLIPSLQSNDRAKSSA